MKQRITPIAPYNMELVLSKLAMDPHYKVDLVRKKLTFPFRVRNEQQHLTGKNRICQITIVGTTEQPELELEFFGDPLTESEYRGVMERLHRRFQWNSTILSDFYQAVQPYPAMKQIVEEYRGTPLTLDDNMYESLTKSIIHQQVNLRFAHQLVYRLSTDYGDSIEHEGEEYFLFPTPAQLAKVEVSELRQKKFSQRKAEYITDIAKKIIQNELRLDELSPLSNSEILERLTQERGVGKWTVECILLFCLGRPNLFPVADVGIQNAIKKIEGLSAKPTQEECQAWVAPFEEWGSYVAIYLWESLGNNKVVKFT
ncbi:DNA-3-methyladenine glycosylase family protein [Caldalkalibacillus mannanilyticus]|uniref:DNA-3-methyladenine glycosylase family protein n=1 Tax=Caldalkalibacillus mannanilyticus TaxID=1418 RepID=UPI000468C04E|nr:DNA-3-methyladenine glycosylase [Caldalkalibacillus mannanilyticus]